MVATPDTIQARCRGLAIRDRHHDVISLLQSVPEDEVLADQDLLFWYALALLSVSRFAQGEGMAEQYEQRHATDDIGLAAGRNHILRAVASVFRGDSEATVRHAELAISVLPENAYHERFRAWATIDTLSGHFGNVARMNEARQHLQDLRDQLPLDQQWWYEFVIPNRADMLAKQGFLNEAELLLEMHLNEATPAKADVLRLRLAILALERGEATKALEWLGDSNPGVPIRYWSIESTIVAAQARTLLGDSEGALSILQEAATTKTLDQSRVELLRAQLQMCEIWVQRGEIVLAETWIGLASRSLDPWPRSFGHPMPKLIQASLQMAKENWVEALALLESLRDEGVRRNQNGVLVPIYAHLAYTHAGLGDDESSVAMVRLAMNAGADGNFARAYRVFGKDVRSFLVRAPSAVISNHGRSTAMRPLLSDRELEVMMLVNEGHGNAEIAEKLFVSVSTVKNHLTSAFKRLGVSNRSDAVHAARQMGLVPAARSNRTEP